MRAVGLAAVVAAGIAACGFVLQWAALPDAGRGDVVAARAAVWLGRYRESAGRLTIDGRRVRAVCYHGWLRGRRGSPRRGTLLVLSDGATIRDLPPHTLLFTRIAPRRPVALLYAAGCTRVLAERLASLAQFDGRIRARRAQLGDAAAYAVDFPHLTLYVARGSDLPIGVNAFGLRGRFRLVRVAHPPDGAL